MVSKANSYILDNLVYLGTKISNAVQSSSKTTYCKLLAVSKTKPLEDIITAHEGAHRLFGENYVEEFLDKIEKLESEPIFKDIEWHFIGHI